MKIINEQEKVGEEKNPVMPFKDAQAVYEAQLSKNRQFFLDATKKDDTFGDVFLATTQKFAQQIEQMPVGTRIYWGQGDIAKAAVSDWAVGAFTKGFFKAKGASSEMAEGLSGVAKGIFSEASGSGALRKRGEQIIISANRDLEELRKRQQSEAITLKESHPILDGLISTGEQYGAAMLMAYVPFVGPALSAAYMAFLEGTGTAVEGLEQYKEQHPEDKELKGFVGDEKSVKEFTLNTLKTFVNGVEEYVLGPAGQARYANKMAKLAERGFKPMRYGALRYAIKRGAIGAAQEFTEEGLLQGTSDTIFDYLLGRYKSGDEAVKAWKENLAQSGFAALYGGVFGVGGAIMDRAKGIEATRELLKDVVAEQDLDKVATVVFENELNNVMDVATVATEISSQLNTQKGEIYDALRSAAFQAAKESGGYKGLTDESLWAHVNEVSERFAQEAVAEAFKRNVPIQEVIDSSDIVYKDGELHLAKVEGDSNLGKKIGDAIQQSKMMKEQSDLQQTMYQLDQENPVYTGDTLNINGVEKTVYNSDGAKIAQSEAALRAFYNWFGDSKVVNDNGQPIVLYRGDTKTDLQTMDQPFIYGVERYDVANSYAGRNGRVYPVYFNAENVVEYDFEGKTFAGEKPGTRKTDILAYEAMQQGKDGVIIRNVQDFGPRALPKSFEPFTEYIVFDSTQVKSLDNSGKFGIGERNIFEQVEGLEKDKKIKRGSFNDNSKVIKLFEGANTSTLPHELSHYWLDNMWNYAKSGNANPQYVAQFNAVKDFLGVKPEQQNLTRAQHEKFASAYEKYLYRGEFPKPIIGTVFDNYERFIRDVYQSINDIKAQGKSKVRLTPEIIQFFDSMVSGELPAVAETADMVNEVKTEQVHQYDSKIVEEVKKEIVQPAELPVQEPISKEILPVGSSGEVAESRFAKRSAEATGLDATIQYERANMENERQKAAEMWKNDPQKAQAELNNATIGNDVLRSALYTEQQRIALENGDTQTYLKSVRKQSAEATRAGQEIAALRGVMEDITMPAYWIRLAEWEAQKQLAKNMATYFDKVMGNTPLLNFTQKFDADVKALYDKVQAAKTNTEKSKIMKEGLEQMKKTYRGLNQQELGELYQTEWTNEELAYDYVEKKARDAIGLNLTNEKANAIIQASRDLDKLSRKVDEFGIPTAEFFAKKSELEYMINSHTPSSQVKVLLSTLGRANMLTAPATSVLNVASNVQNFAAQKIIRGLQNKITGHTNDNLVDTNLQKQYRKRVWDTFWSTGYDLAMMNSIADTRLYRGESAVNSAGEGVIRQAGQWAEKHVFGELISSPDMLFKSYLAFTDFAGNEATEIAYKEGLSGDMAKQRANALFTDAVKVEPTTEIGKQIRAKAQADALVVTFQQDTKLARTLLDLRNLVNKATGDVGVGDLLSAFVKTPANVLALGYDATVGPFGHLINTFGAIQDARAGNLNSARVMSFIRQTTTMAVMQAIVAAFALGFIDDDDYIPDYSQLSPSERLIVKERGGSFGSIRIGDTYISTDFFGPFELPLVAWLNARRQEGFAQSASAYIGSVIRKGMDAPVIKDLMDQAKAAEEVGSDSLSIWEHIYDTAGNLLISRLTPNVMNTLAKMSDDYERETNRKVLNKLIARVPFARETLPPKVSVSTGKPVETPSALMQLLFGSRAHKKVDSAVADELYRLYQQGERATISDITRSGDLRLIDEKDKQAAKEWFAKNYSSEALKLIKSSQYLRLSDEDKKSELNKIRKELVKQLKQKHKDKISVAKQKK